MAISSEVTAIVEGQEISGFISGNVESSMVTPADSFVLRIPRTRELLEILRRDAEITIKFDGVTQLNGFIDKRSRSSRSGVMEIHGRDRVGRLVDESAPAVNYSGLTIEQAINRLIDPFFPSLTVSNEKNRRIRRGKGRRVASATEPVVTINVRVPRRGQVHPGQSRWQLIHEICGRAGLLAYATSDGRELFVGLPNKSQPPQYSFFDGPDASNVRDITVIDDDGDRYSLIMCGGVGGQSDTNYGKNVSSNVGVVFDDPSNRINGTGRDFLRPKRLYLPERTFSSYRDAGRVAKLEADRRNFNRHQLSVEVEGFGQMQTDNSYTFFVPDTVATVVAPEDDIDNSYMIYSCSYSFNRSQGDYTVMRLVTLDTEIIQ